MRVVIISWDSLEYDLVEKYNCRAIMQKEHGKVDLEKYLKGRPKGYGSGNPNTTEVYATMITGIIPTNYDHYNKFVGTFDAENGKSTPTIFSFTDKNVLTAVPTAPGRRVGTLEIYAGHPSFKRYFSNELSLKKIERIYYTYMSAFAAVADSISLGDGELIFLYSAEPDKLQHIYMDITKNEDKYKKLYNFVEDRTREMIEAFDDGKTLIIVHSDHGSNLKGGHSHHGFWSSNMPLDEGNNIDLTRWFHIIKKWLEKDVSEIESDEVDFTEEEKKMVVDRLKKLGYFE